MLFRGRLGTVPKRNGGAPAGESKKEMSGWGSRALGRMGVGSMKRGAAASKNGGAGVGVASIRDGRGCGCGCGTRFAGSGSDPLRFFDERGVIVDATGVASSVARLGRGEMYLSSGSATGAFVGVVATGRSDARSGVPVPGENLLMSCEIDDERDMPADGRPVGVEPVGAESEGGDPDPGRPWIPSKEGGALDGPGSGRPETRWARGESAVWTSTDKSANVQSRSAGSLCLPRSIEREGESWLNREYWLNCECCFADTGVSWGRGIPAAS
jgi:hypothetical protein